MTNSKNTYYNENTSRVHDDCVEGDTVSEGDTSDEEDVAASNKTKRSTRKNSTLTRKEGLELPSGSADGSDRPRAKRRKFVYVALAIAAVVATSAAIGGGIYASKKNSTVSSLPTTTLEGEFAASSSIPVSSKPSADAIPSESEDENDSVQETSKIVYENDSVQDSESNILSKDNTLGLLEEMVDYEENRMSEYEGEKENGSTKDDGARPTEWPDLVGMVGDEAKAQLEFLCGEDAYYIKVLNENSPTTRDYRFDRIRIFTNDEGIVTKVPHVG